VGDEVETVGDPLERAAIEGQARKVLRRSLGIAVLVGVVALLLP
jgi:hypothetical protein